MSHAEQDDIGPTASPAPAVTRAAAILDLLARSGSPVALSELARQLRLPKSSTANICLALEAAALVARNDNGFTLGRKTVELGGAYLSGVDQVRQFYALCAGSPRLGQETARVAVLDGLDVLYLARYDGRQPLRLTAGIGDRFPASCTATGKALLARLPAEVLEDRLSGLHALPRLTERSLSSVAELRAELARTRERGYGVDDQETTPGITCLAVTTAGQRTDSAAMAVSVTVLTARLDSDMRAGLLAELQAVAAGLDNPLVMRP